MKRRTGIALIFILAAGPSASSARAAEDIPMDFFEEEARVQTVLKRPLTLAESPLAVTIVSGETLRRSGAVNFWDALRFQAGLDVVDGRSIDGGRVLLSVRGAPAEFVPDLLVLVDGRSVYSPHVGGVEWGRIPVQLQDIERIEIVRGPSSAIYGSNANRGVINVITRTPKARRCLSANAFNGSQGLRRYGASFEDAKETYGYRLSRTHLSWDGFPAAGRDNGNDFWDSNATNLQGWWEPSRGTVLELHSGLHQAGQGVPAADDPARQTRDGFLLAKFLHDFAGDASFEARGSWSDGVSRQHPDFNGRLDVRESRKELEAVQRLKWGRGLLDTTAGGSYSDSSADSAQSYAGSPRHANRIWRGFLHQSAKIRERLSLLGGASLEDSSTGGLQTAYQGAVLAALTPSQTLRFSYSEASIIPDLYRKYSHYQASASILLSGNPDLKPQRTSSYEFGHVSRWLGGRLKWESTFFYTDTKDRYRAYTQSRVFFPFPQFVVSQDNRNHALSRGVETSASFHSRPGHTVYLNYTHIRITDTAGDAGLTRSTPVHKANLGGTALLPRKFSLSADAGYKDAATMTSVTRSSSVDVPAYWRLDLRLAYAPRESLKLFFGGQDLLRPRHQEYADGLDVARRYYGGLEVVF